MKNLFLVFIAFLALNTPALADDQYLLQQPGETNATGLWINKQPVPGVDCPAGSRVCAWVIQNSDNELSHYAINAQNQQIYLVSSPTIPPAAPIPRPLAFKKALNDDTNIPDSVKVSLFPYLGLIDNYPADPDGTISAWTRTKTVLNIPTEIAAIIEAYAVQFGMPLTH